MNLNADFNLRVVQRPQDASWVASPLPGVTRRMLDRVGAEIARATSVVRYAPDSEFSRHVHGGGEEFLVLEGVFSDETGDFPAGWYVRNPPGTSHAPHSQQGCVILVKLWQFAADDLLPVQLDTGRTEHWRPAQAPGVEIMDLHAHRGVCTRLLRLGADAAIPDAMLAEAPELFVLDGELREGDAQYPAGTWLRCPPQDLPRLRATAQGARLYLKTGAIGADFLRPP